MQSPSTTGDEHRGSGIQYKLKSEMQQISEDISSESNNINNAMQRLTYMYKYLQQRKMNSQGKYGILKCIFV